MDTLSTGHRQNSFTRRLMATVLAVLYLLVVLSPLLSLPMHTLSSAHAATGECSGDCNICGCSLENRANKTCCCAQKLKQQAHAQVDEHDNTSDCCKKKPVEKKTIIACGCPCGGEKQAALSISGTSEVLPFHFTEQFNPPHTDTTYTNLTHRLISRHGEPPEPPPQLDRIS